MRIPPCGAPCCNTLRRRRICGGWSRCGSCRRQRRGIGYAVGDRVAHPKFGQGAIVRIETLAADHKLVVAFEEYGEKTLLAKFAKLTKL